MFAIGEIRALGSMGLTGVEGRDSSASLILIMRDGMCEGYFRRRCWRWFNNKVNSFAYGCAKYITPCCRLFLP